MLTELHIRNLGVIAEANLALGPGLVVITGETGAGKTMIVEAIDLLVGGRADGAIVRHGEEEARVDGRFVLGDREIVLSRVVPAAGRSRAYVDGTPATVSQLAEIGSEVVDLHGQHDHQSLLSASAQRDSLDEFARIDLAPLRALRGRLTEIDAALAALGGDERTRAREIDLLRFQVEEILAASIDDPDEESDLEREQDLLDGATQHRERLFEASALLAEDAQAVDLIGRAAGLLGSGFPEHRERLKELQGAVADLASELRDRAEGLEEDPERQRWVRERRQALVDLRRKYGDSLAEVATFGADAAERLSELEGHGERVEQLTVERSAALDALAAEEARIAALRSRAAPKLAARVCGHLPELAMPHARLEIEVDGSAGEKVAFLLAANPGSPPQPLHKVASGGELARTMLALRMVLSAGPPTLLFDEVDAGIGGEAAVAVARALADIATRHQVLVVSHLAQVAAVASRHILVEKRVRDDSTFTDARLLEDEERVSEVARMLSGGLASATALDHAREMIAAAGS